MLGYSLAELCLEDPDKQLNLTEFTQPAMFAVNALTYFQRQEQGGPMPDFVAGHSLGEYNALLAAGAFDFETGLKLVRKRGELFSRSSEVEGAMAAVIGLSEDRIRDILEKNDLTSLDLANFNSPGQIVISGPRKDIERGKPIFGAEGAKLYAIINAGGAFHSRYMNKAGQAFDDFLKAFEFSEPILPVISNVEGKPYESGKIRENLVRQINHPVLWTKSIQYLVQQGAVDFEEVGPGNVLTRMIRQIRGGGRSKR